MNYLTEYKVKDGFSKVVKTGDGDLKYIEFGIISLKAGKEYSGSTAASEWAFIVLGGKCSIAGEGFSFNAGERKDVFSGKPHTVYIPCGRSFTIKAVTDVEIAWTSSPSDLKKIGRASCRERV